MQIKRLFVFALGFAVGGLFFGVMTALGQNADLLTVRQTLRAPLILDVQIPTSSGQTGAATITIGLDLESITVLADSAPVSNEFNIVPSVDSAGAANVSVRLGDLPPAQVSVDGAGSTSNAPADIATTTVTNTRPVLTADQLSTLGNPVPVTRVVDGETIEVTLDGETVRVRYALLDAPDRDEPFYAESLAVNQQLLTGQSVYLERDISNTDRFGRLLRYVYLPNGTFVNAELVRQGAALLAVDPPDVSRVGEIRTAQAAAQAAGSGAWGVPGAVPPARANSRANLRTGPGTGYDIIGTVETGDVLSVVGISSDEQWYQLENRLWISAALVDNAPADLPTAIEEASVDSGGSGGSASGGSSGWAPTRVPTPKPTPTYTPFVSNMNATPLPVDPSGVLEPTFTPTPTATPTVPTPTVPPCDPSYPQLCIPLGSPPLTCDQIEIDNFLVVPPDPYNFDKDGDGLGCEDE